MTLNNIFKAFLFSFTLIINSIELNAQCNTNASICTPGVAGPFNFVNPGTPVSTCLDWIGPSTGYIILHITTSGPLNMLIDGDANSGYLDVAVFNIPAGQAPCTAIQNTANEIGCNYATAAVGCNQFGTAFGCGSSAPAPNVTAGQELMIVVENWSGSSNDFTLQLGPAPGAQTGPPNPAITPAGPFCSTGSSVQLIAADMGGTWSGPGVSSTGIFNPATAGPGTHTINYSVGTAPCNASSSTTIVVNAPPTLSISPATATVCAGQSVTLTASGAAGYSWSPGGMTTAAVTVSPATTTTYTVTSPGCSGSATRTVNVTPLPNVAVNSPTICAGQTATLTGSGATSYTWSAGPVSTGTNTATVSPTTTTSYTVTGNTSGCSKTAVATVTVTPAPIVNVTSPTICNGITATMTASGATTYTWSAGATSSGASTATASPSTTTTYTVTGANGTCTSTAVSTVTVNPNPTVTVNSATICPGGTATLNAVGGTTYSWSTGASGSSINVSPAGTTSYTVTGTSAGCTGSAIATVTVGSSMTVTVNSPTICAGQTANLTATGATNYSWSAGATSTGGGNATASPATTTSYTVTGTTGSCTGTAVSTVTITTVPTVTVNSPVICNGATANLTANGASTYTWSAGATASGVSTADASPTATTSYTVTGANGTCTNTAVSTVTVNAIPAVSVNSPTICAGTTANLTASGATSYTWSAGATATGTATADASPASTTSYTVTGTTSGCSATAVSTVTVAPSLLVTVNSPTICAGQTANLSAGGATSYTWSAGATSTGPATADATPASTTTYTVTGTSGSCSGTAVSTVTVNPLPIVSVNSPTICDGATANLSASGANTYTWSIGATATGTATADASPSSTTSYTVTGTSSSCSSTAISTVTVNPVPLVTVNSPSICPGSTAQLTAGGATSYTWSAGATSTGANTATASPASTTSYTVTGTASGCTNTAISTVTVNTVLSVNAGADDSVCYGGSANLTVTPNGAGYSYSWTPSATLSDGAVYNPVATPVANTTYNVIVTDANGCSGTDNVTIYANSQITPNVAGLPVNCNGGSDGQTIVIPSGGTSPYTYSWTGGCNLAACNVIAGSYTVTVTDAWGCTATGSATVTEPTAVTVTTTQVNGTCFGSCNGTATATPSGGTGPYSYSWSSNPSQSTATAANLCAGTYTCTITDSHGCSPAAGANSVVVTITEPPAVVIANIPNVTICNSGSTTLNASVSGGTGAYTYSWSPSAGLSSTMVANPIASPPSTTNYTLNVTDANNCTAQTTVTVTVNPPLAVVANGTASICPGATTPVSSTASNGAGTGYTYSWTPSAGLSNPTIATPFASPAVTTTYTVTAADGCSPTVTATVTVTVLPLPVPVITSDVVSGCEPVCVNFTDASTITSPSTVVGWSWNFGDGSAPGTGTITTHCYANAGSYTVTLTDTSDAGCIATSTIPYVITVNPIPVAAFTAPSSTSIFTPTVQYMDESSITSGSIVGWNWSFGDILVSSAEDSSNLQNPSHLFSEIGTYCAQLIVTSNAGCVDTTTMCIVIDPEFTFFIPNAFSPNDDGTNDEFYGKGEYISEYEMSIFDRWGNLIFHCDDINDHWDGRANHGSEVAQEDVYVYSVKLTDNHDKKHKYLGTVTIVK